MRMGLKSRVYLILSVRKTITKCKVATVSNSDKSVTKTAPNWIISILPMMDFGSKFWSTQNHKRKALPNRPAAHSRKFGERKGNACSPKHKGTNWEASNSSCWNWPSNYSYCIGCEWGQTWWGRPSSRWESQLNYRKFTHENDRKDSIWVKTWWSSYGSVVDGVSAVIIDKAAHIDKRSQWPIGQIITFLEGSRRSDSNLIIDSRYSDVHPRQWRITTEDVFHWHHEEKVEKEDIEQQHCQRFHADAIGRVWRLFERIQHDAAVLDWILQLRTT